MPRLRWSGNSWRSTRRRPDSIAFESQPGPATAGILLPSVRPKVLAFTIVPCCDDLDQAVAEYAVSDSVEVVSACWRPEATGSTQ